MKHRPWRRILTIVAGASIAVGAAPLAGKLQDGQELLGAELGIVGQALAELADHASQIDAAFTQADQQLSRAAEGAR